MFAKLKAVVNNLFTDIKDIRIRDLQTTNERLQSELTYRDKFEEALMKRISELENV